MLLISSSLIISIFLSSLSVVYAIPVRYADQDASGVHDFDSNIAVSTVTL